MITTVNPFTSAVAVASVGVASLVNEVPVVLAEFATNPLLLDVTVHVAVIASPIPVTVTVPADWVALPLFVTEKV